MKTYQIDSPRLCKLAVKLALNENSVPRSAIRVGKVAVEVDDSYAPAFEKSVKQAGRLLKQQKDEPEGEVEGS